METMLSGLFSSGRIVDLILVLVVFEGLFLAWLHYYKDKGLAPLQFILHALPGVFIFLALRAALVGSTWQVIAIFLAASFIAHIIDLVFIIRRA